MTVEMRPGDSFQGWRFEALLERGPGPFEVPHPRWGTFDAVTIPRDLHERIDRVEHLRDEIRTGIRDITAPFAARLSDHADRLGCPKAASALRRCASACEARAARIAMANAVGALRSLRS